MIRFASPLIAMAVVLGTAAAGSGDNDYQLVIETPEAAVRICVKSDDDCLAAVSALDAGRWWPFGLTKGTATISCEAHPGCFPFESNFISGFNLPR